MSDDETYLHILSGLGGLNGKAAKWALGEIKRLRAVVDKLPTTADGVPIHLGMIVYTYTRDNGEEMSVVIDRQVVGLWSYGKEVVLNAGGMRSCGQCYSTKKAAEAAMRGEEEGGNQ